MTRVLPLILGAAIALAGCDFKKATAGVQGAMPVVAALEEYHAARGRYPDSLAMLVPDYLPASVVQKAEGARDARSLRYHRSGGGYELRFRYTSPLPSECVYLSEAKTWNCREGL